MKKRIEWISILFSVCLLLVLAGCGKAGQRDTAQFSKSSKAESDSLREWVEFKSKSFSKLQNGDTLTILKAKGMEKFVLHIQRVAETRPGIKSIRAKTAGSEITNALFVVRGQTITGFIDLYKENTRVSVLFDTTARTHYIQKTDNLENDKMEGSAPLIPGDKETIEYR